MQCSLPSVAYPEGHTVPSHASESGADVAGCMQGIEVALMLKPGAATMAGRSSGWQPVSLTSAVRHGWGLQHDPVGEVGIILCTGLGVWAQVS